MVQISRRAFLKAVAAGAGVTLYSFTGSSAYAQRGPQTYTLRILHTNDHHARIEPVTGGTPVAPVHGGVSRRKRLIDDIRKEKGSRNLLVLDAGDVFQGTLWFNQYNGMADLEFYNVMKYDAMTIGNHEFDAGPRALADFLERASFPVLSANITTDSASPIAGKFKPWVIQEVGGQKIGIFGLTPPDTGILSNAGPGVTFGDPIEAARKAVAELRAQGVNKIIGLTHVGIMVDREIARQVSGIAVIIGGHSHTPMGPMLARPSAANPYPEIIANPEGNPVIVAHAWEWGRWLGDVTVGFDANGLVTDVKGPTIEVLPGLEVDRGFENRIAVLRQPLDALRRRVVGESAVALDGSRNNVRAKETNLGNLVADAMLEKARPSGAVVAVMNGGGIRTSIAAGPVTVGQVLEVLPFGNTLARTDITGAQLKAALENGVSQIEQGAGRFPQVAGLRFVFNPEAPVGSRVLSIEVREGDRFVAVDPAKVYRVVTNNFMLTGGDGYSAFAAGTSRVDLGFILADVVQEFITARSPVNYAVDGRITTGTVAAAPVPDAAAPPVAVPGTVPAQLPNTSGNADWLWTLAAIGAGAIGSGLALRSRARVEAPEEAPVTPEAYSGERNG